jgi:hypothetical protein
MTTDPQKITFGEMRGAGVKRAQFKRRAVVRYLFEQTTMTCWRAGNHIITDLLGSLTEPLVGGH